MEASEEYDAKMTNSKVQMSNARKQKGQNAECGCWMRGKCKMTEEKQVMQEDG